jgi:hypothetical protein
MTTFNIAYYEENEYHTEILATFLEPFKNNKNVKIIIYNNRDKSGYVEYFKNIYNYEVKQNELLNNDYMIFNIIIFGSKADIKKLSIENYNINTTLLFINHLKHDLQNTNNIEKIKNIVLTKINKINQNINYLLPLNDCYNITTIKNKNIIGLVGRFKDNNRDIKDLLNSIKYIIDNNIDIEIRLYSRHIKFIPNEIIEISKISNKVRIFYKISMDEMVKKHLNKIKYFIPLIKNNSVYHKDRLSGAIPFAYNYNIPLIIDEKTNQIYELKNVLQYKNSLIEILDTIQNINNDDYNKLLNNMINEKQEIVKNNNINLLKLYNYYE